MSKQPSAHEYPNLEHLLLNNGSYLIGDTKSIRGTAIASDHTMVYAALIRKEGESLGELHQRLDEVVGRVMRGEIEPINEFRTGGSTSAVSAVKRGSPSDRWV